MAGKGQDGTRGARVTYTPAAGRSGSAPLEPELAGALERLAEGNDRTVAAEVRRAIRAHVAVLDPPSPPDVVETTG